jgi:NAD(P)-dependent dehydrogenase (short-subunit alcohol dehydrogenase family)
MAQHRPLAIVAGAGPGLGQSLLAEFQQNGCTAIGLGRTKPAAFAGEFHTIDLANGADTAAMLQGIITQFGPPTIVVHNTAELVISPFEQTSLQDFERCWSAMVGSAITLANGVLPAMAANGTGTFITSGATASLRGGANFAAFASAKFALRGLTQSLAREYHPKGVHVAHVILDGIIDTPRSRDLHDMDPAGMMRPADIANSYWQIAQQPRSTWTHELDLRPASERF